MRRACAVFGGVVVLVAAMGAAFADVALPTHTSAISVTPDGQTVWVVNPDSGSVSKVGANSLSRLGEFAVGRNPRTVALAGTQYAYVTAQDDDVVVRLDQADGGSVLTHTLQFGCAPFGVALSPDGTRVYVTCERTDALVILDPNLQELATITVPWPTPRGIAVSADGSHVYLTHFLTKEPNDTGHVSEIDTTTNTVSRVFDIPLDTTACETLNSAPGVANFLQTIALTPPDSPPEVANQLWVAGTRENVAGKGLFKRSTYFHNLPQARRFAFPFTPFPNADDRSARRSRFKPSFHDIIRSVIAKIDLATGSVKEYADIKGYNAPSGLGFSPDGTLAFTVDRTSNRFAMFNSARSGIINDDPPAHAPGSCTANAFDTVSENPLLQLMPPEVELRADDPAFLEVNGEIGGIALTGLDYDVSTNKMKPIFDGIGTTPIGLAVSPDGERVYTANSLSRTVTVVDARVGSGRCATVPHNPCSTPLDCVNTGVGVCGDSIHGNQIKKCSSDNDCNPGIRCTFNRKCLPQILAIVDSIDHDHDPLPPEIHDGKILFNVSARDSSLANNIGLDRPVPESDYQDPMTPSEPGTVVSTSHDAEYLACSSCHTETGNDGRTWDNSQFGASLRNTLDLRGRASFAPGTCGATAADASKVGQPCTFDAACGSGSPLTTCEADPAFVPMANPAVAAASQRFFNPMGTIHWNADRDEVEDFEHAFRSLQGAGDCDGNEHDPTACIGALIMRSHTTDPVEAADDLGAPNRAIPGTSGIAGIRLTHMADYVYTESDYVRNPNIGAAGEAISFAAKRGRAIFNDPRVGCATCHNGPSADNQQFSDKRPLQAGEAGFDPAQPASADNNPYLRHNVGTANIFDDTDPFVIAMLTAQGGGFQNATPGHEIPGHRGALTDYLTPTLVDAWNTAPYLHDGSAATLLDVVRPCTTRFQDCNAPGTGRNVNDHHGHTSFLTAEQLADLEAFLKAPHGPVGNPIAAELEITSFSLSALEFGFTFPFPVTGTIIPVTIHPTTRQISINGADIPSVMFDTKLAGIATATFDKQVFTGDFDDAGNLVLYNVSLTVNVARQNLHYVFNLHSGTTDLDGYTMTGAPIGRDGTLQVVDIVTGPPAPILGQPTDTACQLTGKLNTVPLTIARNGSIIGVVEDAAGHPLANARVSLRRGARRRAVTGADGRFSFDNLRLTGYLLRVSKPGNGHSLTPVLLNADTPAQDVTITLH